MDGDGSTNIDAISHKGKTVRHYMLEFKLKVIQHAETFSISSAVRHFEVDRRMAARWVKQKTQIHALSTVNKGKLRTRLGGGRKPLNEELETQLLEWVLDPRGKGLRVSRVLIMKKRWLCTAIWMEVAI